MWILVLIYSALYSVWQARFMHTGYNTVWSLLVIFARVFVHGLKAVKNQPDLGSIYVAIFANIIIYQDAGLAHRSPLLTLIIS